MTSWQRPTAADLDRVSSLIGRLPIRAYFFDRLKNPQWVIPLFERGFFRNPPSPVPADEPGYVRYPPWPEGGFLVRMASLVPDDLITVLKQCNQSKNPSVTRLYLEAALALPDDSLKNISYKVVEWVKGPQADLFVEEAISTIRRLLIVGRVKQGLAAAKSLLALGFAHDPVDVTGRFAVWHYEQAIETLLPVVIDQTGLKGVKFFSGLLRRALGLGRSAELDWDATSIIWRPAVEHHEQNQEYGLRPVIVSAIRDAAVCFSKRGESELAETISFLETRPFVLHKRIALHVLATSSEGVVLASDRIADRTLFDDHLLLHEYANFVRNRFGEVSTEAQEKYLRMVADGPNLEEYCRRITKFSGSAPTKERVTAYVGRWQRDRLSFAADYLNQELSEHYQHLVADFGDPEYSDVHVRRWLSMGDKSPVDAHTMAGWAPVQIIEYLRTWMPDHSTGSVFDPSMVGLGRVFSRVLKDLVSEFVPHSTDIESLHPTYVRYFVDALGEAVQDGYALPWAEPLQLMASIADRRFVDGVDEGFVRDQDRSWSGAQRASAWLLQKGFSNSENRIPFSLRDEAWHVLHTLIKYSTPTVVEERAYLGDNWDPYTLSTNTSRGSTMHAMVEYALWCRREIEAGGVDHRPDFSLMPEVRAILEDQLNPEVERSLAIRSVYGKCLPWLLSLDESWVTENLSRILPKDSNPDSVGLRDAAWSTYIKWCPPYDSAFHPLLREYEAAIERVSSANRSVMSLHVDVDVKLGEHLVAFFFRRIAPWSLLDLYFRRANDNVAGAVMESTGRGLLNSDGEVTVAVGQRIQELWDHRLDVILSDPKRHRQEAQAFLITFAAAKLDMEWELTCLDRVLQLGTGVSDLSNLVLERLAGLVDSEPVTVTRLTLAMLENTDDRWDYFDWHDAVRSILVATNDGSLGDIAETRREIIDRYISRGEYDFREFL